MKQQTCTARRVLLGASLAMNFTLILFTTGCGKSPALNHDQAPPLVAQNQNRTASPVPSPTDAQPLAPNDVNDCPLEFREVALCGGIQWDLPPPNGSSPKTPGLPDDEGYRNFKFRFWKKGQGSAAGPYVDPGYRLAVVLWMPSMGHGSSPTKVEPLLDASGTALSGQYGVKQVYFSMDGDWEVRFQLKRGSTVVSQVVAPFEL